MCDVQRFCIVARDYRGVVRSMTAQLVKKARLARGSMVKKCIYAPLMPDCMKISRSVTIRQYVLKIMANGKAPAIKRL